jgi:all-trans-8'-apo-beta-carotenal 15,15'-oxygenase
MPTSTKSSEKKRLDKLEDDLLLEEEMRLGPTFFFPDPDRPLPSHLVDAFIQNAHPVEASQEELGRGLFLTRDWRRAWYTYRPSPQFRADEASPVDVAGTGYADYIIDEDDIEGTVPLDLVGDLYRNGPGNFGFGNERVQHVLDADGLVFCIRFPEPTSSSTFSRRIRFQSRFIETKAFQVERSKGEFLYRGTFGTGPYGIFFDPPRLGLNTDPSKEPWWSKWTKQAFNLNLKNTANTHVISFGGKLLALYEAGLPHALDPQTLETIGEDDLGGVLPRGTLPLKLAVNDWPIDGFIATGVAHTAHPKMCPRTGNLVGWHWTQLVPGKALEITVIEWSERYGFDRPVASCTHRISNCELAPHDIAITENCIIMIVNALEMNQLPFLLGVKGPAASLNMNGRANVTAVVLPRPTAKNQFQPYAISVPPCFAIHFSHGYEDEKTGNLVAFFSGWPPSDSKDFLGAWGGFCPYFPVIPPTFLWRVELNPSTQSCVDLRVAPGSSNICAEHCVVNPNFSTKRARNVYAAASNCIGDSSPPCGYVRLRVEDGCKISLDAGTPNLDVDAYWFGMRQFTDEPIVVPKQHGDPNDEDDAYLLGMVFDAVRQKSALAIFDLKRKLRDGPICMLWLKSHIPHGLHGCFAHKGGGSKSTFC